MKRASAIALALLYALPATWALQGGIDLVRPARVAEAAPDGKCAPHGCGCEESARIRAACCCVPESGPAGPASALEASRCAGTEAAIHTLLVPPALPAGPERLAPRRTVSGPEVPERAPRLDLPAVPPDKVPIG